MNMQEVNLQEIMKEINEELTNYMMDQDLGQSQEEAYQFIKDWVIEKNEGQDLITILEQSWNNDNESGTYYIFINEVNVANINYNTTCEWREDGEDGEEICDYYVMASLFEHNLNENDVDKIESAIIMNALTEI